MLFPPFRSGAAHIMIFGPVFPDLPVPGRTEKCHYRAGGAAEAGNENGCGERKRSHLTLHTKGELELADAKWPISMLANAGSSGIARHRIIAGPVEANPAKLKLALHAAQFRIGDRLDHVFQITIDAV